MRTNIGGQKNLVERRYKVVDTLHVSACGVPDSPDIQYLLEALSMEEVGVKKLACTTSRRRWLPVASPLASTAVHQAGSLVRQSRSGARFVDRALPFLAQMRVPPERRILLVFEPVLSYADETAKVDSPVHV